MEGPIEAKEIETAEQFLVMQDQCKFYPELYEEKDKPKTKHPKLYSQLGVQRDKDGMLRCYGRFNNSKLTVPLLLLVVKVAPSIILSLLRP